MIVRNTISKIVFGLTVVVFTALMAVIQIRNLRNEAIPDDSEKKEKSLHSIDPDGNQAEPELAVLTKLKDYFRKDPESPKPEPFVMKPVGGKDEIEGEYLVSFFDNNDRAAFIRLVEEAGGAALGLSDYGSAVKVRLKNLDQFEDLLKRGPTPLDYSANYSIYYPERPLAEPPVADRIYSVFGKSALGWLGLQTDHIDWGRGVKVAVLDNGVESHPAFKKGKITSIDIVGAAGAGEGAVAGHGTAVASLIAGWHPEVMGVAPDVSIISVRVAGGDGRGDVFDAAIGIMKALEAGVQVINISMGTYGDSFVLRSAVEEAKKRGVVIVASVGNDGQESVMFPAGYDGVTGVSSVDAMGQDLYFGNRGDGVDICAPGYGLSAAWAEGEFTGDFSGTSASAGYVSGMIAVLIGRGVSPADAVERVLNAADDSGMPGRDPVFGSGILNIRRVDEYGKKGIRDAALSGILLEGNQVLIGFQNRGTEVLEAARIAVKSGERYINFDIGPTKPGETVSRRYDLQQSDYSEKGLLVVTAEIDQAGLRDIYPENNARRLVVVRREL